MVDWPVEAVERSWAGLRSFAPDGGRSTGSTSAPGKLLCAGQGGFGIQTAPAASKLAAAVMLEEPDPIGCAGLDPSSFPPRDSSELEPVVGALAVGFGAGERVDAVVFGMAAVALDPVPVDAVRRGGVDQLLP